MSNFLAGYKTYIGIIIAVIGALSGIFGWNLGDLASVQDQVITIVGSIIALVGRFLVKTTPSA